MQPTAPRGSCHTASSAAPVAFLLFVNHWHGQTTMRLVSYLALVEIGENKG